jgi:hypothetical protein
MLDVRDDQCVNDVLIVAWLSLMRTPRLTGGRSTGLGLPTLRWWISWAATLAVVSWLIWEIQRAQCALGMPVSITYDEAVAKAGHRPVAAGGSIPFDRQG